MNTGPAGAQTEIFRGRSDLNLDEKKKKLEHRVKHTYHARLQTAKRMQIRTVAWNTFLVASSIITTIVAIVLLEDPLAYGPRGPIMMVIVGIATFAASLLVTTSNYSARAETFFRGYRDLQRLWAEVASWDHPTKKHLDKLEDRYQQLLDELPNHSEADYLIAMLQIAKRSKPSGTLYPDKTETPSQRAFSDKLKVFASRGFTILPFVLAFCMCVLLVPTIAWLSH